MKTITLEIEDELFKDIKENAYVRRMTGGGLW